MASPVTVPASLKSVSGHFKLAQDNDRIDPVVSYWCRLYVIQNALKIDSKSPEAKAFLIPLMGDLEKVGWFE